MWTQKVTSPLTVMNSSKPHLSCSLVRTPAKIALLTTMLASSSLMGELVDTEIVLLVDVSGSINEANFNMQKDAFAAAFRDNELIQSIGNGCQGSIAATLVYWAGTGNQHTAVEWMKIDDAASANQFADAVASSVQPFSGRTALGEAISHASNLFGTETGAENNGFQSRYQVINVSGNGEDNDTSPRRRDRSLNVDAARDGALAAGVDMIDGIPIVIDSPALDSYYSDHVIGGAANGVAATIESVQDSADLAPVIKNQIMHGVSVGVCATAVPEPETTVILALGLGGFLVRKSRKHTQKTHE